MRKDEPLWEDFQYGPWGSAWPVAERGYKWVAPEPPYLFEPEAPGPYLVAVETGGISGERFARRLYSPLQERRPVHRALWQLYRRHSPSDSALGDAIVKFANRYGKLGLGSVLIPMPAPGTAAFGEPMGSWHAAIAHLGRLVDLWDLVRGRDVARLGQHIVWRREEGGKLGSIMWRGNGPWGEWAEVVAWPSDELYRQWRLGDVLPPARHALAQALNRQLRGAVSPQVAPTPPQGGPLRGSLWPGTLLAMAYLQLYTEVTGERVYRPCAAPRCGEWIDLTQSRADRRFCHDACRQRFHRAGRSS